MIPSHCRISLETSYACFGCNDKPVAVFKAYDIKNEGILEMETNFSWSRPFMSCNPEPYTMTLDSYSEACMIYIPQTNQTIVVNFKHEFVDQLTKLQSYHEESTSDLIDSVARNPALWTALLGSLSSMLLTTLGGSV